MEPRGRTFTREEAEALLPEVDRLLAAAQELAERLAATEQVAQVEQWKPRTNGQVSPGSVRHQPVSEQRALADQLTKLVDQIQDMGVVVRDVRTGLIDFPSLREGRIVYLCWRRGEPLEIRFWHEVRTGFAGRQPL